MNFDEAIMAHTAWKMKLSTYLRKPDGSLKPEEIMHDDRCPLGKWIHGEGKTHATIPEYTELKSEHAKFHVAAAEVVQKADAGKDVTEELLLGSHSQFCTASNSVVSAIRNLRKKTSS